MSVVTGRVLVLGGSWFLGRAVVEDALQAGWAVTTFRRGLSGTDVSGAETVRGDRTSRTDLERLAASGPWDVVVDPSGYVPRESGAIARALEQVAGRFVFVSSVSAYVGWPVEPLTEESAVLDCPPDAGADFGFDGDPGPSVYGFTKAGCERAVREVFGNDRTVVLRPGVILGPREYVGRLPWWLRRMERGGRVLAPGGPSRAIQPVDVRDVARFALLAPAGVFNVTGPTSTMQQFLDACRDVVNLSGREPAAFDVGDGRVLVGGAGGAAVDRAAAVAHLPGHVGGQLGGGVGRGFHPEEPTRDGGQHLGVDEQCQRGCRT
jgi:2'-hydroxyisoflavone reductase